MFKNCPGYTSTIENDTVVSTSLDIKNRFQPFLDQMSVDAGCKLFVRSGSSGVFYFLTPVSTRSYHGGDMNNADFFMYVDKHGIYPYVQGKIPVHACVMPKSMVSGGPSTVL
jgi:hypothetical protein